MKNLSRWAAILALPVLLAACAGQELQHSRGLKTSGDAFMTNAYAGYMDRAEHEYSYGSYPSSDAFAIKARQVAAGTVPAPFTANDNALPNGKVSNAVLPELTQARANLVAMLGGADRNLVPAAAAQALVMYDCWLEEESHIDTWEQVYQPDHAAYCRLMYLAAMREIENARPRPAAVAPAQVAPPAQVASNYLVFFDWDQATLTAQGRDVIRQAAANARSGRINRLTAVGHADSSGTAQYNVGLSQRRAEAVRAALIAEGIPAANIGADWKGETVPLVATGDGVREPQNRRVEVIFQR